MLANNTALGDLLAFGRTADVYTFGEDKILKLFRPWVLADVVKTEQYKASIARSLGIPTPVVGDIIEYAGRVGLVYERIDGVSMMERLSTHSESVKQLACELADLHWVLHQHGSTEQLPAQKDILEHRISHCSLLQETERERLLEALARMPSGNAICHGDFHPGNVISTKQGPVIIDWIDANRGNAIADVARTSLLFRGHIDCDAAATARSAMELYHDTYIDTYMKRAPGRWSEYRAWFRILAGARLCEGIVEQQAWLLQQARLELE